MHAVLVAHADITQQIFTFTNNVLHTQTSQDSIWMFPCYNLALLLSCVQVPLYKQLDNLICKL